MIINLPFYNPPKNPIKLADLTIRAVSSSDSDSVIPISLSVSELLQLPRDKGEFKWAVLETTNNSIPGIVYIAALDLLSNHWKYFLERIIVYARPVNLGEAHEAMKVPRYSFTPSLIDAFSRAIKLLLRERKARIAIQRWSSSYTRQDPLDSVLDCCSALEAALNVPDELRLRISLSAYHLLKKNKKRAFALIYEMYGIRSSFIHGAAFPELDLNKQRNYIDVVAQVLRRYIELGKIPGGDEMGRLILHQFSR